ncbi:MAG: HD-GYP domain-containing protein [Lachnospiraceae bacterium]|nr:HD-GYP domain-containing protein [Lachnospiraceae bacterium]
MMSDYSNDDMLVVGSIFSLVVVGIFIWAFYVILKNMIATNEAIKAKNEIKTLSVEVMEALAHTIDAKDEYTKGHSVRVAKYSRMLAEKLGLNEGDCESVYYMALLHDIGKIGVPNEIINSKSKMTDEEYAIMKTHPCIGSDILEEIKSRPDLMIGARWHHERYDGKGYPDGKAGEDIPFFARIISVADSYDAMT